MHKTYIPTGVKIFGLSPTLFTLSKLIVSDEGPKFCKVTIWSRNSFVHTLDYEVLHVQECIIDAYDLMEED